MKKRIIPFLLVVCLLVSACPVVASAGFFDKVTYYENYTAIGDSICGGFGQVDYDYDAVWDVTEGIDDSPMLCYASLAGKAFDSDVYNLGNCGCDTIELLDILENESNEYYDVYRQYITDSNLITLEIGSNDILFSAIRSILGCIDPSLANMSNVQIMKFGEKMFNGAYDAVLKAALGGNFDSIIQILELALGVELTNEQIQAVAVALTDEALTATLQSAYDTYCANFQQVVSDIRAINPTAELVLLDYYNPMKNLSFSYCGISYHVGAVAQSFISQMNSFVQTYSQDNGYVFVDISDTSTYILHPSIAGHAQIAAKIIDALLNTVTASAGPGGKIAPRGSSIVKRNDSKTFTITPDRGKMINVVYLDGVRVDGSTLTAESGGKYTYTLSGITSDHNVTVKFLPAQSPVTAITDADNDLDFGTVIEDYTAPDGQTVTIVNTGVQTVDLTTPTSDYYTFAFSDSELEPGESATLTIQPKTGLTADDYSGTINVEAVGEYGSGTSTVSVDVSFTVIAHTYIISASAASLDFGTLTEGYTAPAAQDVTITNDGNTALTLTEPTSSHYTFTLGDTDLAPGESTTLSVQPKTDLVYASYDETISINGSNGAITSVDLKFTVNESYKQTTKVEGSDGISVTGLMKHDVQLVVSPLALGSDAGSNAIRVLQGSDSYDFIGGWNLSLTGDYTGSMTITLPVGSQYNGQTLTILHAASSGLKTYSAVVVNGSVTITVTEFSPFAVFATAPADNSPGTGDTSSNFIWYLLAGGSILGTLAVTAVIKHRRKKD